jgi:ABC-type multidrug transport system fused ATPase/permease subunit
MIPEFFVYIMREKKEIKENKTQFNFRQFWLKLWNLIEPVQKKILKLLIIIVFLELSRLVGPYILKLIIDLITNFKAEEIGKIAGLIFLMFFSNQIFSMINYFSDTRIFDILVNIQAYLSNSNFKKMVFLDLGYHEKENTGNKIFKIQRGVEKINDLLGNIFWEVAPTSFQIILTTIVLFAMDWRFGLVLLLYVPIFIFLTLKVNRDVYPQRRERHDKQEEAVGFMAQSIININTVKSFVQERREQRKFGSFTEKIKNLILFEYGRYIKYNLRRNLVIDLGRISMLFFGVYLVSQNLMTIGSLVFVFTISEKALISLYRISRVYDKILEAGESVTRLYDLSLVEPEIKNPLGGIKPKQLTGQIEFKNVSFIYNESRIKALDGVNFGIQPGCVTALVGPSGGGKTTIARLVYRHYDPQGGEVFLDGKDIREYDLYAFREFLAIVPQEVEIFNTSVRENIAYAKPNASFSEIKAAARIANAEEFISELKEGYDTLVGERGIKLSGGQRQRVGIARAILANPKILIFDEATSSLDSYSERLIQEAMDRISKGRTVIIIAHRLSTIKKADKIIVLEKGKVVEEGSHFELAKTDGGLYQKLIKLQQMGDVE